MSDAKREPVAWGVSPGDGLPIWRCSSCEQAQAVVVWLREQRPGTDPQVVPLVDGRDPAPPTLTDAERGALRAIRRTVMYQPHADAIDALLARHGGEP